MILHTGTRFRNINQRVKVRTTVFWMSGVWSIIVVSWKEQKMYCPRCGKEIQQGSVYCPSCGQRINAAPTKNRNPRWMKWIGIAAVLGVAIIIAASVVHEKEHTIDLNECLSYSYVEDPGEMGEGELIVSIDEEKFLEVMAGKMKFNRKEYDKYCKKEIDDDETSELISLLYDIRYSMNTRDAAAIAFDVIHDMDYGVLDQSDHLKNGEEVIWNWKLSSTFREAFQKIFSCRLKADSKKVKVDGFPEYLTTGKNITIEQADEMLSGLYDDIYYYGENYFLPEFTDFTVSYLGNVFIYYDSEDQELKNNVDLTIENALEGEFYQGFELDSQENIQNIMVVFVKITNNNIDDPIPRYCMAAVYVNVRQGGDGKLLYDTCNKNVAYHFDETGASKPVDHDSFKTVIQPEIRRIMSELEDALRSSSEFQDAINESLQEDGVQEQFSPNLLHCEINIDSL